MFTAEYCRAARGLLNWTQKDLANRAHVSLSTVRDFESGKRLPISNNLQAMWRALEIGGVEFHNHGAGLLICLRQPRPRLEYSCVPPSKRTGRSADDIDLF